MADESGTIVEGEYHPAADSAMIWYRAFITQKPVQFAQIKEALASTALSGNRLSEICMSTIKRLESGEPVSDRYLLGLTWTIMGIADDRVKHWKTYESHLMTLFNHKWHPTNNEEK